MLPPPPSSAMGFKNVVAKGSSPLHPKTGGSQGSLVLVGGSSGAGSGLDAGAGLLGSGSGRLNPGRGKLGRSIPHASTHGRPIHSFMYPFNAAPNKRRRLIAIVKHAH